MSRYNDENFIEKIGSIIPGYTGYSAKESRRDTDKLLRLEIAKQLDRLKEPINGIIRQQMDDKKMDFINELDRIKIDIDIAANQIRFAACGESGFFDVVQVNTADLDRLYQYDLDIREELDHLVQKINSLRSYEHLRTDCSSVRALLSVLSASIRDRENLMTEVK